VGGGEGMNGSALIAPLSIFAITVLVNFKKT